MRSFRLQKLCGVAVSSLALMSQACGAPDEGPTSSATAATGSELPAFERSPEALQQTSDAVIADSSQRLTSLAALADEAPQNLTFANTVGAYEETVDRVETAKGRAALLASVHPDGVLRMKAAEVYRGYEAWLTSVQNRGEVYRTLLAFARTNPQLVADQEKLMDDTLQAFHRNGVREDGTPHPDALRLQTEILALQSEIAGTVASANMQKNYFTAAELEGLAPEQLAVLSKEGERYVVLSGDRVTLRTVITAYATKEATRLRAERITDSRAADNIPLITSLTQKRLELAQVLGFATWADYRIQTNMAKTGAAVSELLDTVSGRLKPKLAREIATLSELLVPGANDDDGQINLWDVSYFKRLSDQKMLAGEEQPSQHFSYERVVQGLFESCEEAFGLKIDVVPGAEVWHPDVRLVRISERDNGRAGAPLGYVYLDNFPRLELGKYNHFGTIEVVSGRVLEDGGYRLPVAAMLGNFPINPDGTPANLAPSQIEPLLHEFGHVLHIVLGKARYASQSSFHAPVDYLEVPSTMLAEWRFDPAFIQRVAEPSVSPDFGQRRAAAWNAARQAYVGLQHESQLGMFQIDLAMHRFRDVSSIPSAESPQNLNAVANQIMADTCMPFPEGTSFLSSFTPILTERYDAGYYAYAWSDGVAAELTNAFASPSSPLGVINPELGARYRREVLEPANSRDATVSVEAFLGHPIDPNHAALLKRLGIDQP